MSKEFWQIFGLQAMFVVTLWIFGMCTLAWGEVYVPPELNFDNYYQVQGAVAPTCPSSAQNCCDLHQNFVLVSSTTYTRYYRMYLFFTDNATADAYRNSGVFAGFTNFSASISETGWSARHKTQKYGYDASGYIEIHHQVVIWVVAGDTSYYTAIEAPDRDQDGLADSVDPFPDDDEPFMWKRFSSCKGSQGTIVSFVIKAIKATGESRYMQYGDPEACTTYDVIDLYDDLKKSENLPAYFSSGGEYASYEGFGQYHPEGYELEFAAGIGEGFIEGNSDPGTNDSDRLSAIVANTKADAENTARLGDYLAGIGDSISRTNEILGSQQGETTGSGIPVSGTDMQITEEKLEQIRSNTEKSGDGLTPWFDFDVGTQYNSSNFKGAIDETDGISAPELESMPWYQEILQLNPYVTALQNSEFSLIGEECSMYFNSARFGVLGFSICEFNEAFSQAGYVLLSLCSLSGLITIVRGR